MERSVMSESSTAQTQTTTLLETDVTDSGSQWRNPRLLLNVCKIHRNVRYSCTNSEDNKSPLSGVRILDLTRIIAGPYCTMTLGDLGAEILKIEKPNSGDETRKWGPPFIKDTNKSTYFPCVNRNKKSICIDLKQGKDIIYELAKVSDVLVENYVPGKLEKMGLGYNDIAKVAPHLIYCSLTGYGYSGPYSNRPGYDVIAASIGGLLHITGPKDGSPCKVGVAVTDLATGLYAHGAILAALYQRVATKRGQWIQCNLLATQVASLINIGSNYLNAGKEAVKWGSEHESIVPYEAFPTKDGYMTVGAGSDAQFLDLLQKMQLTELSKSDKYKNNTARVQNREHLLAILRKVFQSKTNKEWAVAFEGAAFPYGPINKMSEDVPTVRLCLRKPRSSKKVQWMQGTVDNEHMNKKKSKCCCIYEKPRNFGESSSEDSDDECEHCHGHKDAHKKIVNYNAGTSKEEVSPSGSETMADTST